MQEQGGRAGWRGGFGWCPAERSGGLSARRARRDGPARLIEALQRDILALTERIGQLQRRTETRRTE